MEIVGEARPGIELERQTEARVGGTTGRAAEVSGHPREVIRGQRPEGVAGDDEQRDAEPAAEGGSEMGEVAAHADALEMAFGSGSVRPRVVIAELNLVVGIVDDGLNPLPA